MIDCPRHRVVRLCVKTSTHAGVRNRGAVAKVVALMLQHWVNTAEGLISIAGKFVQCVAG